MNIEELIERIEEHRLNLMDDDIDVGPDDPEMDFFNVDREVSFASVMYVPHTENHIPMLDLLKPDDIVCDMGAGDLRFALMASQKVKRIYAIEFNPVTMGDALRIIGYHKPRNLIPICTDWRFIEIPADVNVIVCMVNGAVVPKDDWKKHNRRVYFGATDGNGGTITEL